jgi:hypothetical protein
MDCAWELSGNRIYQIFMQHSLGRPGYGKLVREPLYAMGARALSSGFFILALGFLWLPVAPARSALGSWFMAALLVLVTMLLMTLADTLALRCRAVFRAPGALTLLIVESAATVAYLPLGGPVPPLLYAYF